MRKFVSSPVGRIVISFVKAFVAAFIVFVPGILAAPDFTAKKAAAVAAVVAAFDAALKAVQIASEKL